MPFLIVEALVPVKYSHVHESRGGFRFPFTPLPHGLATT